MNNDNLTPYQKELLEAASDWVDTVDDLHLRMADEGEIIRAYEKFKKLLLRALDSNLVVKEMNEIKNIVGEKLK
jgi:hypothetical protein